jgi:hypothetical protein
LLARDQPPVLLDELIRPDVHGPFFLAVAGVGRGREVD